MPKRTDINTILLIGSGPIVIGQACEFDYSGTQAAKTLKELGYRVVLINSNPATIMTDPEFADRTYVEPITPEVVDRIIKKENVDAILPTMGGQTALNVAMEMHEAGMDLLIGADIGVLNVFPGFSIHDEMALFVTELGMTPAEVIERATSRSAKFLRIADSVGTIERGKVADLVLLEANPLEDIRNTRRIAAVVLRGALYDSSGLDQILAAVRAAPDRQIDDWGRKSPARDRK